MRIIFCIIFLGLMYLYYKICLHINEKYIRSTIFLLGTIIIFIVVVDLAEYVMNDYEIHDLICSTSSLSWIEVCYQFY